MSVIESHAAKPAPVVFDLETVLASSRHDLAIAKDTFDEFQAYAREERAELLKLTGRASLCPPEREALQNRVHRLKSSAGFVGANRVYQAAAALQAQLLARDPPAAAGRALRALSDALEEFLRIHSFENAFKLTRQDRSGARGHEAAEGGAAVKSPQASS